MRFKGVITCLVLTLLSASFAAAEDNAPIAITGGTVLTVTNGTIEGGTVLIRNGKIEAVGKDIAIPDGAKIIDATGKFVMPGIIDAHSHIALDGDVNEATSPSTPEVLMIHALVPDDYAIYQALAGGVTAAKLMHGSANVIGGVNVTVKLKWGVRADEMVMQDVRQQIKMALGENPKRLYGDKGREPSTRPGIFALLRQQLLDAQAYKKQWDRYNEKVAAGEDADPPRRDLHKDVLVDVLTGKLAVDCHCYVASEIEVFLDIAKEFNLQHVVLSHALESFKVRDKIAEAGVSVLGHTDWWGYKMEAWDAIPYDLGMLVGDGINTCIVSDSGDVMRRLNREAAKVIKYSGITEDQALAMITINSARALEIENRTGSLEIGKDADIAIFERHPLDSYSRCVMTLVEGKIMFDIDNVDTAMLE